MASDKKRLINAWEVLNDQQRLSLLDFAEYLSSQTVAETSTHEPEQKQTPLPQSRPEGENVVNAIKRLRASYFMLNTDKLLNETSALMAQFMIQGREASAVIDDLEILFDQHYQKYLQS